MERTLSNIFKTDSLEYAIYTLEKRSLAHMIDGLKPVQRFVLYSTLKSASNDFEKVASLGSAVSKFGYNHGEVSAQEALQNMAAEWTNNIPIIAGRGNFGSRMVNEAAAARYVYAKKHDNFDKYFKDVKLSPEHKDVEHIPPAFYVPVVPIILANGVSGIATGFASKIPPHCPDWLKKATLEALNGKEVSEPVVKFPDFTGEVVFDGTKYIQYGKVSISGLTVTVTEIPTTYDHEKYCAVLDSLQESGKISSWIDETSNTFQFKVKFKRGSDMTESKVIKTLKLSSSFTPNINVIDHTGRLRQYDDAKELVVDFVSYRLSFLEKRISHGINHSSEEMNRAKARVEFIKCVIAGDIVIHGKKKAELISEIEESELMKPFARELVTMPLDRLTNDEVAKLEKEHEHWIKEHKYWSTTTPKKEFASDLKGL